MRIVLYIISVCLGLVSPNAWSNDVLVRLAGGEVITIDDLSEYLSRRVDLRTMVKSEWGLKVALTEMAETRALVLEGARLGESRGERPMEDRFDDVYAMAVYRKQTPVCERPADERASRAFFDSTPEAFRLPVQMRLSRVMIPAKATIDKMPADTWIQLQLQAIVSGAAKFESVAERAGSIHTRDPQGDLGWVLMADDVPLLKAIATTREGDMVGPVREGDFLYLFMVLGRRDARQLTWDEVAKQVPTRALQYCVTQSKAKMRESLFKRYGVQFEDQTIRTLSLEGGVEPRENKQ